jgi:hypothetical protein
MTKPEPWECELWERVLLALRMRGRVRTSYYVMAEEAVRMCRQHDGR